VDSEEDEDEVAFADHALLHRTDNGGYVLELFDGEADPAESVHRFPLEIDPVAPRETSTVPVTQLLERATDALNDAGYLPTSDWERHATGHRIEVAPTGVPKVLRMR
jgi:hypothetical protein